MQMTGAEFNVSARGDNQPLANKLLVMVDGRSIYVDAQGIVYWKAIPVTLPEIKRIEVLKGPASALYGFNAFDGVINIITKSPEEMKGATLQFGGGELGTISSAAIYAGIQGKLGYRLSAGRDQNQQWNNRDALAFRSNKFNVQTEYALSQDSKLMVSGGLVDVNKFDGSIIELAHDSQRSSQGYAYVAYERPNFFLRWWNGYSADSNVNVIPPLSNFIGVTGVNRSSLDTSSTDTYNVEAQHAIEFGPSNRLSYGINYRHNTLSSSFTSGFGREDRVGFYLQDEWHPTQTLTSVAGLRYDLDTFIHPTVSPRVALVYNPVEDHTFRATMSVAYRPPTLSERNLLSVAIITLPPPFPSPPPTLALGSTTLNPEEIVSYEIGYQGWYLRHTLRTRANLFFNHLSNLINNRPTSPGIASNFNDPGQADIYGGEAGVEFLATSWLTGFGNFSYEEIGQSFTDTSRRGAPRFKFNVGLRGEWENGLSTESALFHVGAATYPIPGSFTTFAPLGGFTPPSTSIGSYNLLNFRSGYKFWKQKTSAGYLREAEVAFSAFNALNDKHKEHPLSDTIGSRVMSWLTVRF
jgi:iron complex outermembrane receptor protein